MDEMTSGRSLAAAAMPAGRPEDTLPTGKDLIGGAGSVGLNRGWNLVTLATFERY